MKVTKDKIYVHNGWIHVDGIGRIGMYLNDVHEIGLDYSMKFIVGTNERIKCDEHEIQDKIYELFNQNSLEYQKELCNKLRTETGYGIMKCKRVLIDSKWNYDEALKYLKENPETRTLY